MNMHARERAKAHLSTWKRFAPLGLLGVGTGASLLGHATLMKGEGRAAWQWVAAGALSLVVLNAGLCVFGEAVKHRALYDWHREQDG